MPRFTMIVPIAILIVTAGVVFTLNVILPEKQTDISKFLEEIESLSNISTDEVRSIRESSLVISSQINEARIRVGNVANTRSRLPSQNPFNNDARDAIRRADSNKQNALLPIVTNLGLLSQQILDIQARATSLDTRLHDGIRELKTKIDKHFTQTKKNIFSLETVVALMGIITSLIMLVISISKEVRESRESKLKFLELENKVSELEAK